VALVLAAAQGPWGAAAALAATFVNPIVEAAAATGSADPSVVLDHGHYYYCRAIGDRAIGIARARRLQDIGAAEMTVVFRPPADAPYSRQLWAPELERIGSRWYIYFTASDGDNASHRMYVLQSLGSDPRGPYRPKARLTPRPDAWAIDGIAIRLHGGRYFVWSGWPAEHAGFPQNLYIARMSNPWTVVGERHLLAAPDRAWEQAGAPLLEGPELLRHGARIFIVYSASASWGDDYALGALAYLGGDPLEQASWRKLARPLFGKNPEAGVFAVGHVSFVRSPDGREDWIIYHATSRPGAGWRQRSVRAQRFGWGADGLPRFGAAVGAGVAIEAPSPGRPASAPRAPPLRPREPPRTRSSPASRCADGCRPRPGPRTSA
jgi:GH43 family beta-xylosidase